MGNCYLTNTILIEALPAASFERMKTLHGIRISMVCQLLFGGPVLDRVEALRVRLKGGWRREKDVPCASRNQATLTRL